MDGIRDVGIPASLCKPATVDTLADLSVLQSPSLSLLPFPVFKEVLKAGLAMSLSAV